VAGYAPPGSRTELLKDVYPKYTPKGIHIEELSIPSSRPDTVQLSTLLLRRRDVASAAAPEHVIVYCQGIYLPLLVSRLCHFTLGLGNAGNPLHRIPVFATLLNAVPSLVILAPAPRSYWTSTNARPTQAGLIADYTAALAFAASRFPTSRLTIYGHSLGASIALCLLARRKGAAVVGAVELHGLVLENAFTSVPDMLRALYPQRWLPYRYLGPFVRDRWDARAAAATAAAAQTFPRRAMVLVSERDEVVPPAMGREIFGALQGGEGVGDIGEGEDGGEVVRGRGGMRGAPLGLGRFVVLEGALHEDAWRGREWSRVMKQYLDGLRREPTDPPSPI
jgi:pimeloyl-ACP methyl ester carboxylesterase